MKDKKAFGSFIKEKRIETQVGKLAQENARYMISVFTPTTMEYTVSFRQLFLIIDYFEKLIDIYILNNNPKTKREMSALLILK